MSPLRSQTIVIMLSFWASLAGIWQSLGLLAWAGCTGSDPRPSALEAAPPLPGAQTGESPMHTWWDLERFNAFFHPISPVAGEADKASASLLAQRRVRGRPTVGFGTHARTQGPRVSRPTLASSHPEPHVISPLLGKSPRTVCAKLRRKTFGPWSLVSAGVRARVQASMRCAVGRGVSCRQRCTSRRRAQAGSKPFEPQSPREAGLSGWIRVGL